MKDTSIAAVQLADVADVELGRTLFPKQHSHLHVVVQSHLRMLSVAPLPTPYTPTPIKR